MPWKPPVTCSLSFPCPPPCCLLGPLPFYLRKRALARSWWQLQYFSQSQQVGHCVLSLEELPWEGPWRGTCLLSLERIWGDTSYLISWGYLWHWKDACYTVPQGVCDTVCFMWWFMWTPCERNGSRYSSWQMGQQALEQRGAMYTYKEPFEGFEQLLGIGDSGLLFSGKTGRLAYGASLCTRLCSGFCLGTLQSSMSGNTSSCAARPRSR